MTYCQNILLTLIGQEKDNIKRYGRTCKLAQSPIQGLKLQKSVNYVGIFNSVYQKYFHYGSGF